MRIKTRCSPRWQPWAITFFITRHRLQCTELHRRLGWQAASRSPRRSAWPCPPSYSRHRRGQTYIIRHSDTDCWLVSIRPGSACTLQVSQPRPPLRRVIRPCLGAGARLPSMGNEALETGPTFTPAGADVARDSATPSVWAKLRRPVRIVITRPCCFAAKTAGDGCSATARASGGDVECRTRMTRRLRPCARGA